MDKWHSAEDLKLTANVLRDAAALVAMAAKVQAMPMTKTNDAYFRLLDDARYMLAYALNDLNT